MSFPQFSHHRHQQPKKGQQAALASSFRKSMKKHYSFPHANSQPVGNINLSTPAVNKLTNGMWSKEKQTVLDSSTFGNKSPCWRVLGLLSSWWHRSGFLVVETQTLTLNCFQSDAPIRNTPLKRANLSLVQRAEGPSTLTLYFSKTPAWYIFTAQFSAVCPPKAAKMPSGFSRSMTLTTNSGVTGRKYTRSAIPADVWTVAMLGLIKTDITPASLSALMAWLPE